MQRIKAGPAPWGNTGPNGDGGGDGDNGSGSGIGDDGSGVGTPCSGADVPCSIIQVGSTGQSDDSTIILGPDGSAMGIYGFFQSYDYVVVDSNGDPIQGDLAVTEDLSVLYSIGGQPPSVGPPWTTNPFTDNVGYGTSIANAAPFEPYVSATIQTFSVQAGGLNYQLGTQVLQTVTYAAGAVMGNASILNP